MTLETLELVSTNNTLVPNRFIRQETSTHLAIVSPGLGYNADMPLLYYTTRVLTRQGADVLQLLYNYQSEAFQSLSQEAQYQTIIADYSAAYNAATTQRTYSRITLVGKSLGTLALGHLLTQQPKLKTASFIWLTPLFNNNLLRQQIASVKHRGLFVIGTKDAHYSAETLEETKTKTGGESFVVEGANHSLEVEEVTGSTNILQQYVSKLSSFLDKP
jgi:hypothetical protein